MTKDKDPGDLPKSDKPRNNSQLHNTAKFNSEVEPKDYPKEERAAGDLTGKTKAKR